MQPKDDISGELNLLRFPHLDRSLPQYQVPEAYFNVFPQRVLALVCSRENVLEASGTGSALPVADRSGFPYPLPADYFSGFPARVLEMARVAFSEVPDGIEMTTFTAKQHPFRLADDQYFETLGTQVLNRIRRASDENASEERLSPVLADLKSKNVFKVPEGYFDAEVLQPAIQKPLIPAHPAHKSIKWSSWIAAAGILLIFTLGGRGLFVNSSGPVPASEAGFEVALNAIPEEEIAEYLEMTMSEYELAGFYADNASWDHLMDEQSRKELLNDIPIEDIKAYIEGGGI